MKQFIKQRSLTGLLLFIALFSIVPSQVTAIAGTIYFNRNGETLINGSQFTVEVRGKVSKPGIGGGTTTIVTYDQNKLSVVNYNDTGGIFANGNPKNWDQTGPGKVRYESRVAWNAPAVNDQKLIAITFKVTGTGSTTLSFASGTSIHNGPTTGTASTFSLIAATCPPGQVGTPPNCSSPSPSPTPTPTNIPTPTKAPIAPTTPKPSTAPSTNPVTATELTEAPTVDSNGGLAIENVKTTTSRQKNSVTWSMNASDVEPSLSYGLSKTNLNSKATVNILSDGSFEGIFKDVKPGTLYYFSINAATADQLKSTNYTGTFTTKGYPVQITVKSGGVIAPNAKVVIGTRNFISNKDGLITAEFGDGTYQASVTPQNATSNYTSNITVKKVVIPPTEEPQTQKLELDGTIQVVNEVTNENPIPFMLIGAISVLAGIGLLGLLLYRKKRNRSYSDDAIDSDLLVSNYGSAIDNSRVQTPVPNLEVQTATSLPADEKFDPYQTSPAPLVEQNELQTTPSVAQEIQTTDNFSNPTNSENNIDPSIAPEYQPINYNNTDAISSNPTINTPAPSQIDEQLSEQLIAVESIDSNVNDAADSEEAIYHPETGELDIIHNSHPSAQPIDDHQHMAPAAASQPPTNDSVPTSTQFTPTSAPLQPSELQIRTSP